MSQNFLCVSLNNAVNCYDYIALEIEELKGMEDWWNDTDRGKLKYSVKKLSQCTLPTTNPTWTGLGLNPGLRGDRLAANCLGHDTFSTSLEDRICQESIN
jgi:hypothetical protein